MVVAVAVLLVVDVDPVPVDQRPVRRETTVASSSVVQVSLGRLVHLAGPRSVTPTAGWQVTTTGLHNEVRSASEAPDHTRPEGYGGSVPDDPKSEIDAAWLAEIKRRAEDLRSGRVQPVTWDEIKAAIEANRSSRGTATRNVGPHYLTRGAGAPITDAEAEYFRNLPDGTLPRIPVDQDDVER